MAMLDQDPMTFLQYLYVFSGPFILIKEGTRDLPGEAAALSLLSVSQDRFSEPEKDYTAILLPGTEAAPAPAPEGFFWLRLREYFVWEKPDVSKAARAMSLFRWRSSHRFCGVCGSPLRNTTGETARTCDGCGKVIYPAIEPCIIVRIERGDEILLARHTQRNMDVFTCIAGFMEPGETIEECCVREIREEAAIEVTNIRYRATQSWPFPDQLMIALSCEWLSGEPTPDRKEIESLRWFTRDALPPIPPAGSVSHKLIMGEV